jgi:hypothetical protein
LFLRTTTPTTKVERMREKARTKTRRKARTNARRKARTNARAKTREKVERTMAREKVERTMEGVVRRLDVFVMVSAPEDVSAH